jgi:hexose oxidase
MRSSPLPRRPLLTRRSAIAGSIAGLLAATGKPFAQAKAQLVEAAGGGAGTDLLVLEPNSAQFVGLTQGFNRRWTAPNCAKIFVPLTEAGAQQALTQALPFGPGKIRLRGGGHCYENFVFSADTLALIDVSLLNECGFDRQRNVFYAQSGGTNWDMYRQLYWRFGRTLPAGSCYSVGLGGHICGGGYGLLSRQFGLTVDWLSGVHVVGVNGNGSAVFNQVSKNSPPGPEQDLFWAHTGGGGGNFGVITRYEFAALPVAPQYAEIATWSWSWDTIAQNGAGYLGQIIAFFQYLTRTMPPTFFGLLKLAHQQAGKVSLVAQMTYNAPTQDRTLRAELQRALDKFGLAKDATPPAGPIVGHPVFIATPKSYQNLRWIEAVQTLNGSGPNQKGKYKSAYMRKDFPDDQIRTIYKYLTWKPPSDAIDMSQSLLQVDSYGGRINTVAREATAVWQRSSIYKLQYQTYWQDPLSGDGPDGHVYIGWINDFYGEVYAASGGIPDPAKDTTNNVDGCYINYCDTALNVYGLQTALRLYYGGNLPRLVKTKQQWDPLNYFQNAQSIPLKI